VIRIFLVYLKTRGGRDRLCGAMYPEPSFRVPENEMPCTLIRAFVYLKTSSHSMIIALQSHLLAYRPPHHLLLLSITSCTGIERLLDYDDSLTRLHLSAASNQ